MIDLGGKRVLITGAAERLGAAIARAFAECGAAVTVHCFRSKDAAEALVRTLPCKAPFIRHEVVSCDLADLNAVREMAESLALSLFEKKLVASSITLYVGYSRQHPR